MDRPIERNNVELYHMKKQKAKRLGYLFILSNLFVIIFTVFPVVYRFPDIDRQVNREDWYGYDDIIRLLEPIIALPLQILIFLESSVFVKYSLAQGFERKSIISIVMFSVMASIYQQGAGYHSAANMFKHPVQTLIEKFPTSVTEFPIILDIYDWIRNIWEHYISHYMVIQN
jgi:hypothetical protein